MKPICSAAFVLSLSIASASWDVVLADDPKQPITLTVGVENVELLPYFSGENHGDYYGFARDLLDRFARDKGYELEYVSLPIRRLTRSFLEGKLDLRFPDHPDWNLEEKGGVEVYYSDPVIPFTTGFMVPLKDGHHETLGTGASVGYVRGYAFPPAWQQMPLSREVAYAPTSATESLVQMMEYRRVDAVYGNPYVLEWHTNHWPRDARYYMTRCLPFLEDFYRLSSVLHPDVVGDFNDYLREHEGSVLSLMGFWGFHGILNQWQPERQEIECGEE